MTKILALDVGDKRIGVAISDPTRTIATPFETIKKERGVYQKLTQLVKDNEISEIVIGLPLEESGAEGSQATKTKSFAKNLSLNLEKNLKADPPGVQFLDERFTSSQAKQQIKTVGKGWSKDKGIVDKYAACLILEAFLAKAQ